MHKNDIIRGLVGRYGKIFVMGVKQMYSNIWIFKDWCLRMLIDSLSFSILICINDLTLFTHLERVKVILFTFVPMSAICLDGLHKNFKVMFPVYGFRSTIGRPFGNTSRREMSLVVFGSPIITWPAGLYEWGIFTCQSNIYPPLL